MTPPQPAFLSTPPSRVATGVFGITLFRAKVSIHATLAGGDLALSADITASFGFYPRHPRGWRRPLALWDVFPGRVSIHATLAGGDLVVVGLGVAQRGFLSTPPSRVATACPLAGVMGAAGFYPRHPRGWRRVYLSTRRRVLWRFLSTPPSRVATMEIPEGYVGMLVSIHATLAGGDGLSYVPFDGYIAVSIHATLAGGDGRASTSAFRGGIVSIHATLAGGDLLIL